MAQVSVVGRQSADLILDRLASARRNLDK
ncbi:Uncharacterized protein APZ42_012688 [Daphnia magna]|uniref:Uncharacterized protein n=1 Tax=Daphnia magna TaxID=35525 RepID=A0A162RKL6_9CRUS|nr:Uncharacterized protein APZ42_012688 [Daphnia magna]